LHFSALEGTVNTDISELVLKEAYARLGIKINVRRYPGDRSLRYSNRGDTDGELFRIDNINFKYQNLVKVSVPVNEMEAVAYSKRDDIKASGWSSLLPYKVGIRKGVKFSEYGTKLMKPYVVNLNQQLVSILLKGKVDLIVLSRGNGLEMIKKFKSPEIKAIEPPIQKYSLFHYLHKKNSYLVPGLEKVLGEMEAEGFIKNLRKSVLEKVAKEL
jgi:polar amino acid transport system substrate-binding protein